MPSGVRVQKKKKKKIPPSARSSPTRSPPILAPSPRFNSPPPPPILLAGRSPPPPCPGASFPSHGPFHPNPLPFVLVDYQIEARRPSLAGQRGAAAQELRRRGRLARRRARAYVDARRSVDARLGFAAAALTPATRTATSTVAAALLRLSSAWTLSSDVLTGNRQNEEPALFLQMRCRRDKEADLPLLFSGGNDDAENGLLLIDPCCGKEDQAHRHEVRVTSSSSGPCS